MNLMTGLIVVVPILLVRFLLTSILSKEALKRAAFFPPTRGNEKPAYYVNIATTLLLIVVPFFLKTDLHGPVGITGLCLWFMFRPPAVAPGAWLAYDALARSVLPAISLLFLACAVYGVWYLRVRAERPNRVFVALMLAILGLLSAGHQARHLGVLWIATEAVTLAAVPLLHFNHTARAIEATFTRPSPSTLSAVSPGVW